MQDAQHQTANSLIKQTPGTTIGKEQAMKNSQMVASSRFSFSWRDLARNLYLYDNGVIANGDVTTNAKRESTNKMNIKGSQWCPLCHQEREGECPIHGTCRAFVKPVDPEKEGMELTHAIKSFPEEVQLCRSSIPGVGYGVCARRTIPIGTWIGPYEGLRIDPSYVTPDMDTSYMWEIYKDGKLFCFIDALDQNTSSWMRFIRCARNKEEQNLFAFQYLGNIYYRAYREIPPGNELLVWYDDKYPQYMGIPADIYDLSIMNARTPNGGQQQQESKKPNSPSDTRSPSSHQAQSQLSPRYTQSSASGSPNQPTVNGNLLRANSQPATFISTRNSAFSPPLSRGITVSQNSIGSNAIPQNMISPFQGQILKTYDGMNGVRPQNTVPSSSPSLNPRPENTRFQFPSMSRNYTETSTASSINYSYPLHSHQPPNRRMSLQAPPPLNSVTMNGKCNGENARLSPPEISPPCRSPAKSPKKDNIKTEKKEEKKAEDEDKGNFDPNEFGMWRCGQCKKSFAQRILLQVHVCPPNKPFQCGHCSETFLRSEDLRGHVVNHINDKPFRCGYCSRSFAGATTLNNHIRTHTGEKPFMCENCGKHFTQASQLQRHERNPGECVRLASRPY